MKVDLKLGQHQTLKKGDLLICDENNTIIPIAKEELLGELKKEIVLLGNELNYMKNFLKVYQSETTKLLKGVLNNG